MPEFRDTVVIFNMTIYWTCEPLGVTGPDMISLCLNDWIAPITIFSIIAATIVMYIIWRYFWREWKCRTLISSMKNCSCSGGLSLMLKISSLQTTGKNYCGSSIRCLKATVRSWLSWAVWNAGGIEWPLPLMGNIPQRQKNAVIHDPDRLTRIEDVDRETLFEVDYGDTNDMTWICRGKSRPNGLDYCMGCSWWIRFGCIADSVPDRIPCDRIKPLPIKRFPITKRARIPCTSSVSKNLNSHRSYLVSSGKASRWHPYRSVEDACRMAGL